MAEHEAGSVGPGETVSPKGESGIRAPAEPTTPAHANGQIAPCDTLHTTGCAEPTRNTGGRPNNDPVHNGLACPAGGSQTHRRTPGSPWQMCHSRPVRIRARQAVARTVDEAVDFVRARLAQTESAEPLGACLDAL